MSTATDGGAARLARLRAALADPEARAAQPGLGERIAIEMGEDSFGLVPGAGGYEAVRPAPVDCTVRLEAAPEAWARALAPMPAPGDHSITALRRSGRLAVAGDPIAFARSLHLLERLLEVWRGRPPRAPAPSVPRDLGQVEGRYRRLEMPDGSAATVYAESAGSGAPVVFLHTAGADGRQWHGVLADVGLARRWRLHAFDLPMHGRSMPPAEWDGGRWVLTQDRYAAWCAGFLEQVVGGPAVIVGCSMGAAMALVLAATRPDLVRGVVALEAPYRARGRLSPFLAHAAVNAAEHNPSYVRGLMGPAAPDAARRAAAWIYAQGGPGVYAGDLVFYSEEFDGGAVAPRIDGARCPVAFLTGAYDYSAPPEDARRLGALVAGSSVEVMAGLGHFPMVEDPDRFRTHLAPVLDRIAHRPDGARP